MKIYAKICHEDEGVVVENKFETEREAYAFVMGFYAALGALDIDDDAHFACTDDKPAKDEEMTDAKDESTRIPFPNKDCYDYIIANGFERGSNLANKLMAYAEWGWDEALKRHLSKCAMPKFDKSATCIGATKVHADGNCPHCDPAGFRIRQLTNDVATHARIADRCAGGLHAAKEKIRKLEAEVARLKGQA
jgi:hypothetical protein